MKRDNLCVQCGKHPCFQHNGKAFELCAVCGWKAICMVLKIQNDPSKTPERQVTEAVDFTAYKEWAKLPLDRGI